MASLLSAYLISNGAADTPLPRDGQPKPGTDAKPDEPSRPSSSTGQAAGRAPAAAGGWCEPGERAGRRQAGMTGRRGRNRQAQARPGRAATGRGWQAPAGRASEELAAKRTASAEAERAWPNEPPSDCQRPTRPRPTRAKTDAAKTDAAKDEPAKGEPAKDDKPSSETAKDEDSKPEGTKPSGEGKSEAAKEAVKIDAPKATGAALPALRADPVPPVTPAPAAAPAAARGGFQRSSRTGPGAAGTRCAVCAAIGDGFGAAAGPAPDHRRRRSASIRQPNRPTEQARRHPDASRCRRRGRFRRTASPAAAAATAAAPAMAAPPRPATDALRSPAATLARPSRARSAVSESTLIARRPGRLICRARDQARTSGRGRCADVFCVIDGIEKHTATALASIAMLAKACRPNSKPGLIGRAWAGSMRKRVTSRKRLLPAARRRRGALPDRRIRRRRRALRRPRPGLPDGSRCPRRD